MRVRSCALLAAFIVVVGLLVSCGDEGTVDCESCACDPDLCPPAPKDVVLRNLEVAYNARRIDWYEDVLDADFRFYPSRPDALSGMPHSWDRAADVVIHTKLFDKNYPLLPCQTCVVDILTQEGHAWTEFVPPSAPTETWYRTSLYYDFRFDIGGATHIPMTGARAEFTVRNAGTSEAPHWQLVEMHDLANASVAAQTTRATEPTTWGRVLDLYRDGPRAELLNTKEKVLRNIELAYSERTVEWYETLSDPNLTFFLSAGDVVNGLPEHWDRTTEVEIHTRFFDPYYATSPAQSIALDIDTEFVNWVELVPPSAPNEKWYTTALFYTYVFKIAPNTYIPPAGSKAVFTVRNTGSDVAPAWKLVELRDLSDASSLRLTDPSSWGKVKALYR